MGLRVTRILSSVSAKILNFPSVLNQYYLLVVAVVAVATVAAESAVRSSGRSAQK
jgi:hypothetical protein